MIFTLLTGNLRRGRPLDAFKSAKYVAVWAEGQAPAGTTTGNTAGGVYQTRTLLGKSPITDDGSTKFRVPSGAGVVLELQDDSGKSLVTMTEEHQMGPGEQITMGIRQELFNAVCGGCHGSLSGKELDVAVTPDALTGASQSLSALSNPTNIGN
jgi:mono/diheme cytochrome c family protein